ncbi:MAG: hypothetical protein H6656_10115 [Ardenticatenaceae bacterium]|nr:hypothetical protein [Ardenticatenaceae bacterium]
MDDGFNAVQVVTGYPGGKHVRKPHSLPMRWEACKGCVGREDRCCLFYFIFVLFLCDKSNFQSDRHLYGLQTFPASRQWRRWRTFVMPPGAAL